MQSVQAPAEAPKKRRGRPPRSSIANHVRAAAAAAALVNKPRLGKASLITLIHDCNAAHGPCWSSRQPVSVCSAGVVRHAAGVQGV